MNKYATTKLALSLILVISSISPTVFAMPSGQSYGNPGVRPPLTPNSSGPAPVLPKNLFFQAAESDPTWWEDWGRNTARDDDPAMLDHSKVIAVVLYKAYGVEVPFDDTEPRKVWPAIYQEPDRRIPGDWCGKIVANQLSRSLAAATSMTNPGKTYHKRSSDEAVIRNSKEYLAYSYKLLRNYCGDAPFISSYESFLVDYVKVIHARMVAEAKVEQLAMEKAAADAAAEKREKDRLADEEQRRVQLAEAKEERMQLLAEQHANEQWAAKKAEEERVRQLVQAQRKAELAGYREELRSGKRKLATVRDALILHEAVDGTELAFSPLIRPDSKVYKLSGTLRPSEDGIMLYQVDSRGPQSFYFIGKPTSKTLPEANYVPRFNVPSIIVGRYIDNAKYNTVGGQLKVAPVFEVIAIGPR